MKDGFIKVKAISPEITAGDVSGNAKKIIEAIDQAERMGVKILVTPALCLCGYSAYDLIAHSTILSACKKSIEDIQSFTRGKDILCVIGAPLRVGSRVLSGAYAIKGGQILGFCSAMHLTKEEKRVFSALRYDEFEIIEQGGSRFDVRSDLVLEVGGADGFTVGFEIGSDIKRKCAEADVICHLGTGNETINSEEQRRVIIKGESLVGNLAYIVANPPSSETTTDVIYGAHNIICENGVILAQSKPFEKKNGECVSEIDTQRLTALRMNAGIYYDGPVSESIEFTKRATLLTRRINPHPFKTTREGCEKAIEICARSLARRLEASYSKKMVVGISGGLDSTMALVTMVRCAQILNWDMSNIIAITMPCFGTTSRTKSNAITLCQEYGVELREINISEAVSGHFSDIDHDENDYNVTFENAQARERTQVLMDVANDEGALVVGTGDLSEIALGWCTYNADHMSMYNVNSSLPKTLIRQILSVYAEKCRNEAEANIIYDVLDTPVSPELLPADENGNIAQKTEEVVGSYDLNDFFLYNMVHLGFAPSKTYRLACIAFEDKCDPELIYETLERFIKRFFSQQFKRSCSPDGIQASDVSLSPRGSFKMASDMSAQSYLDELSSNI